jgi:hypothetical protein
VIFRIAIGLATSMIAYSCFHKTTKNVTLLENDGNFQIKPKSGLKIEYGPNLGITHKDDRGVSHLYLHSTATITNDSTIPIYLQFALANEYEFPIFCGDEKYKVFLLPEELTPDTATIYNNIVNGQHDFLNTPLDNHSVINRTLDPGEYCVITIGTLTPKPSNCAPVPRAIFSQDTKGVYQGCDRHSNEEISTDPQLEIGVKLEYYNQRKFIAPEDACTVIPFGQISYPGH